MLLTDFSPTKPTQAQIETIECVNREYSHLAEGTILNVAPSAHRTAALRLLLESKMTMIHAVTHPPVTVSSEYTKQTRVYEKKTIE